MSRLKKADISINTIIIAVIAILVLVVLVLIFTGVIGNFQRVSSNCQDNLKGFCTTAQACRSQGGQSLGAQDCEKQLGQGAICCKTLI